MLSSDNYQEIAEISEKIKDQLTDNQLYAPTVLELCYHTLTFFDFKVGELSITDDESIRQGCFTICKLCGWDKDILAEGLGGEPQPVDYVKNYMRLFLQFESAPGEELNKLSAIVNADLQKIDASIANYQTFSFISNGETPRNHRDRTIKAFYDRCMEERHKITEYIANGMKIRALNKALGQSPLGSGMRFMESFFDRPYKSPYGYSEKLFDYTKIDSVTHRVGPLLVSEANELKALYVMDKPLFYEKLLEKIPVDEPLETLSKYGDYLPLFKEQRKEIFKELIELYKSGKWFGFYALGLAQIEGLFGDMCKLCDPTFNKPKATLPDKVGEIRPHYKGPEIRLDYFQYEVPNQRNAFLHKGITTREDVNEQQEIATLCNDVLFDLSECLKIYGILDTDANWLNRLIRNPDIMEFHSVGSFCFYFGLVSGVKQKRQFYFFEESIKNLNQSVFPDYIFSIAYDIKQDYETAYLAFERTINLIVSAGETPFNLSEAGGLDINNNAALIRSEINNYLLSELEDHLKFLLQVKKFMGSYSSVLDIAFLSDDTLKLLNDFYTEQVVKQLNNVSQIANLIDFKS